LDTNQKHAYEKTQINSKKPPGYRKNIGMSLEVQLKGIYTDLRQMSIGELPYSMDSTHYSDVYGLFVSKSASCAGATRARALPESTWNPVHSCK